MTDHVPNTIGRSKARSAFDELDLEYLPAATIADLPEGTICFDGFEAALVGHTWNDGEPVAVYDRERCIEVLMADMPWEEAEEYFGFNVEGAYVGPGTPRFVIEICTACGAPPMMCECPEVADADAAAA